jgi:hypothetical protein
MKVRSEFVSQLSLYLDNKLSRDAFREWHVRQSLECEKLSTDEQAFLAAINSRYADLLAGLPEETFKESLKYLLPRESIQPAVELIARSYVISASTVLVDVTASAGQPISASGTFIPNYEDTLIAC